MFVKSFEFGVEEMWGVLVGWGVGKDYCMDVF